MQPGKGPPSGARMRRIDVDGQPLEFELRRSKRRTIGFLIDDAGLRVTAPRWVGLAEIEAAVREKRRWILAKLAEWRERGNRDPIAPMRWEHGATIPYLGGAIGLDLQTPARSTGIVEHEGGPALRLALPSDAGERRIKDAVQSWLQGEAKRVFAQRVPVFAERIGVRVREVRLSSASTRWGSCGADGRVLLHWRLILFAPGIIDYVVAHELAHLREMNHGPRFWAVVQSVFPDFEAARRALKNHDPLPEF